MNFQNAITSGFQKYVAFSGRASRSEYWYWFLFSIIIGIATGFLDVAIFGEPTPTNPTAAMSPINSLASLALLLPGISVGVRRMHDVNRSGWWILIPFTIIGIIPYLIWVCTKGTSGGNRFGDDPLV